MRGSAQSFTGTSDGSFTESALASLRDKAGATLSSTSKGKDPVGKAFQSAHNSAGWDRKARWQRAMNLARDKMGVCGGDESIPVDKWGSGGKDGGDSTGGDRRSASAQPTRRGSAVGLGPGGPGAPLACGAPGTIVELRTPVALKEHLKRGRGGREFGIQLATLEAGLDGLSAEDTAALVAQYQQRKELLGAPPPPSGRPATLTPADRVQRVWTAANAAAAAGGGDAGSAAATGGSTGAVGMVNGGTAVSPGALLAGIGGSSAPASGAAGALTPTSLSPSGAALGVFPGGSTPGSNPVSRSREESQSGVASSVFPGGYNSRDNSVGPSTPTAAAAAAAATAMGTPRASLTGIGGAGSIGGSLMASRRLSENGTASFSVGGSGCANTPGGGGGGGGAAAGSATFPSVRRSNAVPYESSIIARPTSARREALQQMLRVSVDTATTATTTTTTANGTVLIGADASQSCGTGTGASGDGGGGANGIAVLPSAVQTNRTVAGVDSPSLATRGCSLSRQASGVVLAPLDHPTPTVGAVDPSAGGSGGSNIGIGGSGVQQQQQPPLPLRPSSAGRRLPSSVPLLQPSGLPYNGATTTHWAASSDPAAAAQVSGGGGGGSVGGAPASPITAPPMHRPLPVLQLPAGTTEHHSPTRTVGLISNAHHDGDAAVLPHRLVSPTSDGGPPQTPPSLLQVAIASPSGPAATAAAATAAATIATSGAWTTWCGVGSGSGGSTSTSGSSGTVAPVPPPMLQEMSGAACARRARLHASLTGDMATAQLPGLHSSSSPGAVPAPLLQQAWAAPPSPSSPPPTLLLSSGGPAGYAGNGGAGGGGAGGLTTWASSATAGAAVTPESTPPASPLLQQLVFSPSAPSVASGSSSAAAAATVTAPPIAAAPPPRTSLVQASPSSPWPSISPGYRRATSSMPGTPTAPGTLGPTPPHGGPTAGGFSAGSGPQPPSSPQVYRPHAPPQPPPLHLGAHGTVTSPNHRRSSVTIPATASGLGGGSSNGGGGSGAIGPSILGSRPAVSSSLSTVPGSSSHPCGLGAGSGGGNASAGGVRPPPQPAAADGGGGGGRSNGWLDAPLSPALSVGAVPSPSRGPPTYGGAGSSSSSAAAVTAAAAAAGAKSGSAAAAPAGASTGAVQTPNSDAVLADLRLVTTEVEGELAREAEVAATLRQAQAQALRTRIRMSDSGKARAHISMPGDPWKKW